MTPEQIQLARSIALPGRDTVQRILDELADATGVPLEDIRNGTSRPHVGLRQMAMTLARREGLSLPVIAACFGVDHSTVYHAEKVMGPQIVGPVFRSVRGLCNSAK
jgi:chromosomal replication initiation ATPase DnaA